MDNNVDYMWKVIGIILSYLITFSIGYFCEVIFNEKPTHNNNTEIQATNDSIKLQVKQLDSLKNEKVIEVKGLSNDSTLKLFKQLVNEE